MGAFTGDLEEVAGCQAGKNLPQAVVGGARNGAVGLVTRLSIQNAVFSRNAASSEMTERVIYSRGGVA